MIILLSAGVLLSTGDMTEVIPENVNVVHAEDDGIVFIGDSRTVGMHQVIGDDGNVWSGEIGKGLNWMMTTGVPNVERKITDGTKVVIMMGFNDVYTVSKADDYSDYLNRKTEGWVDKGAEVYYVSVNPITWDSVNNGAITNDKVEKWNELIQDGLSENIMYIDTYSDVVGELYAGDGVHYDNDSYKKIYNLVLEGIENLEKYEYGRPYSRTADTGKTVTDSSATGVAEIVDAPSPESGAVSDATTEPEETGILAGIKKWFINWWKSLFG